jgi:hypothetical protein
LLSSFLPGHFGDFGFGPHRFPGHPDFFPGGHMAFLGQHHGKYSRDTILNTILHTAWLDNHALTLKSNTAKYYSGEKSSFLHTFLKCCCESKKI